jgi:hypothetical protein
MRIEFTYNRSSQNSQIMTTSRIKPGKRRAAESIRGRMNWAAERKLSRNMNIPIA